MGLVLEPVSALRAVALDQLLNVRSLMLSSLAIAEYYCPFLIRLTASSLSSKVYDCRGMFIAHLPSSDFNNMSLLWKAKYQGKLKLSVVCTVTTLDGAVFLARQVLVWLCCFRN